MTKKDCILIARVINSRVPDKYGRIPKRLLIEDFVDVLIDDKHFDVRKFQEACYEED